ncbi:hypothetical protein ABIB30_002001 [Pedobacter sp. UYP1]
MRSGGAYGAFRNNGKLFVRFCIVNTKNFTQKLKLWLSKQD